jgi:hypothetical protein
MYNQDIPSRAELPTLRQLMRSTLIAAVSAAVLLLAVVLPAEYGVDPTGVGRILGLTQMGETKIRLAQEAAQEAAAAAVDPAASQGALGKASLPPVAAPASPAPPPAAQPDTVPAATTWRDEMSFTLKPGQGTEIKLKMNQDDKALYAWNVQGGVVNFDTHGDGIGRSISYEKGRAVASDEGELSAAFTGQHGWFWRNRGETDVVVVLRTRGTYSDIQRVK